MIRRVGWSGESDKRVVKWALVAAALALSVGYYAEHTLAARTAPDATTVAEQTMEVRSADTVRGAS